jgi:hypothetical protein
MVRRLFTESALFRTALRYEIALLKSPDWTRKNHAPQRRRLGELPSLNYHIDCDSWMNGHGFAGGGSGGTELGSGAKAHHYLRLFRHD